MRFLIVQGGRITFERYGEGFDAASTHHSWSKAKSITQALIGLLVKDGKLDIKAAADVPEWANDARAAITLDQLLRMSSGLKFSRRLRAERRVVRRHRDAVSRGQGRRRGLRGGAAFRACAGHLLVVRQRHDEHREPHRVARAQCLRRRLQALHASTRLFEPLGIRSAKPRFDKAGVFIGSSYCFMTARDFARFGLLYLRDGMWDGRRVLPEGWVDYARTPTFQQAGRRRAIATAHIGGSTSAGRARSPRTAMTGSSRSSRRTAISSSCGTA